MQYATVGESLEDNVLELFHRLQTAGVLQSVLIYVLYAVATVGRHGLFAKLTGRRLEVLLGKRIGYVGGNQLVLCHQFWLQPYTE